MVSIATNIPNAKRFVFKSDTILLVCLFLFGISDAISRAFAVDIYAKFIVAAIVIPYVIFCIYKKKHIEQLKIMLALAFMGSELFMFLFFILLLPKIVANGKQIFFGRYKYSSFCLLILLLYSFGLIIWVNIFIEHALFSGIMWLLLGAAGPVVFLYFTRTSYNTSEFEYVFGFFKKILLIQFVILPIQFLIFRNPEPGDWWAGSMGDAFKLGLFMSLYFSYHILASLILKHTHWKYLLKPRRIFILISLAVVLILSDAKIVLLSFFLSFFLLILYLLIIQIFKKTKNISNLKVIKLFIIYIVSFNTFYYGANLYISKLTEGTFDLKGVFELYTDTDNSELSFNYKYVLYSRIFKTTLHENKASWLFGVGPGRFGSRSSNLMAYDVLYKEPGQFKLPEAIPPYSSPWVKKYMRDLWTEEIATTSTDRSATLSFPFAGIASIKAETGLIGLFLFMFFCLAIIYELMNKQSEAIYMDFQQWKQALALFWMALPILMIFDNTHEKPQIMYALYGLSALLLNTVVTKKNNESTAHH